MDVDVVDGLTAVIAGINDGAIAARKALGAGDVSRNPQQMTKKFLVFFFSFCGGCDVLPRYDENVHGRLWVDVCKGVALVVLIDGRRRNASVDNPAE